VDHNRVADSVITVNPSASWTQQWADSAISATVPTRHTSCNSMQHKIRVNIGQFSVTVAYK